MIPIAPPRSETGVVLKERLARDATVVASESTDLILCSEGWNLPLPHLACELIDSRRDYVDFASRVLTRSDIEWTPLLTQQAQAIAVDASARHPSAPVETPAGAMCP